MWKRNAFEFTVAGRRELHQHLAAILPAARAPHQPALFQPVNQFHRAVVLDLKPFGEKADRGSLLCRNAFHGKQCLILLRLESGGARVALAEVQIPPNRIPERGQRLVVESRSAGLGHIRVRLYRNPM